MHRSSTTRIQKFWDIWKEQYLTSLREKWRNNPLPGTDPLVGQIVIIQEEETSRNQWRLGRIVELLSNRTALVKVSPGGLITRRAIQHLYPLEIEPQITLISDECSTRDRGQMSDHIVSDQPMVGKETRRSKRNRKLKHDTNFMYEKELDQLKANNWVNSTIAQKQRKTPRRAWWKAPLIGLLMILVLLLKCIPTLSSPESQSWKGRGPGLAVLSPSISVRKSSVSPMKKENHFIYPRRRVIRRRYRIKPRTFLSRANNNNDSNTAYPLPTDVITTTERTTSKVTMSTANTPFASQSTRKVVRIPVITKAPSTPVTEKVKPVLPTKVSLAHYIKLEVEWKFHLNLGQNIG